MTVLYDDRLLESYMEKFGIRSYFDTENIDFKLLRFDRGNMLTMMQTEMKYFLFVVSGEFKIYGINEDGCSYSVARNDSGARFSFLGDVEFAGSRYSEFDTEAVTEVICVGLSYDDYYDVLHRDVRFLNFIIGRMSRRMAESSAVSLPSQSIEDKLINYLTRLSPEHEINGIEKTVTQIHCSRRQLQRVIAKMCAEGRLLKKGKGRYALCPADTH